MAEQILKTKIALKIKTLQDWTDNYADYEPLRGEVCLCEIPNTQTSPLAAPAPLVLFKVGDGQHTFAQLDWVSAKAADVYSWAKKSEDEFKAWVKTLVTVNDIDLSNYYTKGKVDELLAANSTADKAYADGVAATAKSQAIEAAAADATTKANGARDAAKGYADELNTAMGVRVKALEDHKDDYKDYADQAKAEAINTAAADATTKAGNAETAAKGYADTEIGKLANGAVKNNADAILAEKNRAEGVEGGLRTDVNNIKADYLKGADKTELEGKITANTNEIARVDAALKLAVENNTDGMDSIKELAAWIEEHGEAAAEIVSGLNEEIAARQAGDKALGERIDDVISTHKTDKAALEKAITDGDAAALKTAKEYTDAEVLKDRNRIAELEAHDEDYKGADATLKAELQAEIDADVKALADTRVKANEEAIEAINHETTGIYAQAKAYADELAGNYATAAQGVKADNALQGVEVGTGLKVTAKANNKQTIAIDEEVIFILDCNW
jgi:hypothetical protein